LYIPVESQAIFPESVITGPLNDQILGTGAPISNIAEITMEAMHKDKRWK
jgi:hypothetical protein